MALEGVYVPVTASWVSRLPAELLSFPAGQHDDEVDQDLSDSGLCPDTTNTAANRGFEESGQVIFFALLSYRCFRGARQSHLLQRNQQQ